VDHGAIGEDATRPLLDTGFDSQLQSFVGTCQVLAGAASARERSLPDITRTLCAALPQRRCSADFLLLRSIVTEFAIRAVERTDGATVAALVPLMRLRPDDQPLAEVLATCLANAETSTRRDSPRSVSALRAQRALAVIAQRCGEPHLDAATVAAAIQVSERYLRRLLHAATGAGFRTSLRKTRIKAAQVLLEESLGSVKEIAAQVGYSWTSQFDRDFQRECGVTPGRYRVAHASRARVSSCDRLR
jgi:AraC-like DNA-binding protein